MPRKQKTVYEKIEIIQNKIEEKKQDIKELEVQLLALNKEKEAIEMRQMFEYAKENNLSIDEVLSAINMFSIKNNKSK